MKTISMLRCKMATVQKDDIEYPVLDGNLIIEACEQLGVPFACYTGDCGICVINIDEGEDNLFELSKKEKRFGLNKIHRLACQCRIKKGKIRIRL